jgi:hypothetical protein
VLGPNVETQALPILSCLRCERCPFGKAASSALASFPSCCPSSLARGLPCVDPVGARKTVGLVAIGEYNEATLPPNPRWPIEWPSEFRFS